MQDFDISKPPAKGHADVGPFAWEIYEVSKTWRDDTLGMSARWLDMHTLYRGDHWGNSRKKNSLTIGLGFSNINRTVATITAENPIAEVIDLDGKNEHQSKVATARIRKWWLDSKQGTRLSTSALNSEIYGITWEKSVWDSKIREPKAIICDPFAIFPYPGYYENMATDCPAISHATAEDPKVIQRIYDTDEKVEPSDTYTLLGGEREEITGASTFGTVTTPSTSGQHYRHEKALIVEVWFRDDNVKGGIRVVTVTNNGKLVLGDELNPNINWKLFDLQSEAVRKNYLFSRFPFNKNNSYADSTSVFGFSAAEQTGPLNIAIDQLMTSYYDATIRSMKPILVAAKSAGLRPSHLNNKPNLVLIGDTDAGAASIRFLMPPPPPPAILDAMHELIALHDRVYAIEDIDRGQAPNGVTAGNAIMAMQERNDVLNRAKIIGMDSLVSERGKYALAQWTMHGHKSEPIEVNGEVAEFRGDSMVGMNFNYAVESGSTVAKTSIQIQEQAINLAQGGWVDQTYLLEALNVPDATRVIERMGEDRLGQAMEILIQAGMSEEDAQQIAQMLQAPQGGSGHDPEKQAQNMGGQGGQQGSHRQ
jgi:hypothetical protein